MAHLNNLSGNVVDLSDAELGAAFRLALTAIRKGEDITAFSAWEILSPECQQVASNLVEALWDYAEEK